MISIQLRSLLSRSGASSLVRSSIRNKSGSERPDAKDDNFFEKDRLSSASVFEIFGTKKNRELFLHKYNPSSFSIARWKLFTKEIDVKADLMDQKYLPERHYILGSNLATSHFIVARKGRVKFREFPDWVTDVSVLPNKYEVGWTVDSIDASGLLLRYEGFDNFIQLSYLNTLILAGCPHIDDWCMDKISEMFRNTLECLDISDCPKVTYRSLSCFYRFRNLKLLKVHNISNSNEFKMSCLLLEDIFPELTIEGVSYETDDDTSKVN